MTFPQSKKKKTKRNCSPDLWTDLLILTSDYLLHSSYMAPKFSILRLKIIISPPEPSPLPVVLYLDSGHKIWSRDPRIIFFFFSCSLPTSFKYCCVLEMVHLKYFSFQSPSLFSHCYCSHHPLSKLLQYVPACFLPNMLPLLQNIILTGARMCFLRQL